AAEPCATCEKRGVCPGSRASRRRRRHRADPAGRGGMNGSLMGRAVALMAAVAACHGKTTVVPAIQCADPCCGGELTNLDCAESPNLSCTEDADPCVARVYGCADGSDFLGYPDVTPSGCVDESGAGTGGLVLDGSPPDSSDAGAEN